MKVTIKDFTYSTMSLKIGKYDIRVDNGNNCFSLVFNKHYYWALSCDSARHFLEIFKNDDKRYICLLKISGILGYSRRIRAMENLLKEYGDSTSINAFAQTIRACYLSICITKSFHDYQVVRPEIKKLKRYLKNDLDSMKWINYFEKLDIKFIANTIGKSE